MTNTTDHKANELESFECPTCGELYAGIPCDDAGECTTCVGFNPEAGE